MRLLVIALLMMVSKIKQLQPLSYCGILTVRHYAAPAFNEILFVYG